MRAVVFDQFSGPLSIRSVPDPSPARHGAVIEVAATGLCRSDWHGWRGHDSGIALPHVPGHELAGRIAALGPDVTRWRVGDRVTVPFICACGRCSSCAAGLQTVCENQTQPGFTHWGSFADYVALDHADVNLVALPDDLGFDTAAVLGCRVATSYRAVVTLGRVAPGEWVAVHGCGGVGLSAVAIAAAAGARVVAVDISEQALDLARSLGAEAATTDARAVVDLTGGGAHLSLDALGSAQTCAGSINSLRRRGRHVQVGLFTEDPAVPMARVIAYELEVLGSHGLAAHGYPALLGMVASGRLPVQRMITRRIPLGEAAAALAEMDSVPGNGVTVIEPALGG
ncbi:zinc-dependent alcohol dehydrogenase family protein [Actinokineospora bangkokensis]|uniref:Alcohol dehydrogenase n=1 Tax=Actinokineospora bangkokensis TaxID=1193682 RepID=A0A1Q9LJ72_9PSEU|nr:zinc-dependent alcohol dehydrogenase family protein [Actinokineospora bangkokensis]OLR92044.1 alcohol dehydrogenase [Actinokineospora bangkokensis]